MNMVLQKHEGRPASSSDLKRFRECLREWLIDHKYIVKRNFLLEDVVCWEYAERTFLSGFVTVMDRERGTFLRCGFHFHLENDEIVLVSKERRG